MSAGAGATLRRAQRPAVALVTTHWCADTGVDAEEPAVVARLLAGALARRADVSVVHLAPVASALRQPATTDSVFTCHTIPVQGAAPGTAAVVRAALGTAGAPLAAATGPLFERLAGTARGVPALLEEMAPDAVVLIGHRQPWDVTVLGPIQRRSGPPGGLGRPGRLCIVPLLEDPGMVGLPHVARLLARADAVGTVHPGEERALGAAMRSLGGDLAVLDVALAVSPPGRRLFGIEPDQRYVAVLRSLGGPTPGLARPVSPEVLERALGAVGVVEVDGEEWWYTHGGERVLLAVRPSRVNLWRLMEHAVATIDLRSQGPFGREALESMLLGTPALVPEPGAAMEHVRAASGGLWFRGVAELLDTAGALTDGALATRLGAQGRAYARARHADPGGFVERVARLVLGR